MIKPAPCSCRTVSKIETIEADALSRRSLLGGAALLAGAAAGLMSLRARAQQKKMAQSAVQYQNSPKGDARCDGCTFFEAPSSCKMVDGTISPSGWCMLFTKKS